MTFRPARGTLPKAGACLALFALAARAGVGVPPAPSSGEFWMKRYPLRDYGAFWHLELAAKDFAQARRQVESVLAKSKAKLLVPPANQVGSDKVKYMQWSVAFSRADGAKALERLESLAAVKKEARQENPLPEVPAEAALKLEKLEAERAAAGSVLERLGSTRAAVDEIRAHLAAAVKAWKDSEDRVLLNLSLEEQPR